MVMSLFIDSAGLSPLAAERGIGSHVGLREKWQ
jgi:hypothetical protein